MTKATLLKDGINWGIVYNLIHFHVREHGTIKATTGALVKSATFGSTPHPQIPGLRPKQNTETRLTPFSSPELPHTPEHITSNCLVQVLTSYWIEVSGRV